MICFNAKPKTSFFSSMTLMAVFFVELTLSGCVSLLPEPSVPPKEFTLGSLENLDNFESFEKRASNPPRKRSQKNLTIKIEKTISAAPFQTQKILILSEEGKVLSSNYLANVIWNEPLSDLVQCRLVEELRRERNFKGVGHAHESFRPDFLYLPALHHFEILKINETYKAVVAMSLREVNYQTRTLQRETIVRHEIPVQASLESFIAGLNQSFLRALEDAITWIEDSPISPH